MRGYEYIPKTRLLYFYSQRPTWGVRPHPHRHVNVTAAASILEWQPEESLAELP